MITMRIVCPVCRDPLGLDYWEVFTHITCEPPSEETLQAQAHAMERRFHQLERRVKLAVAGVILTHGGAPKRRRRRGGRGRKKVAQ